MNYPATSNRASCFNHYCTVYDLHRTVSYTLFTGVYVWAIPSLLFLCCLGYAAMKDSFSMRNPSCRILKAAFWSRLIVFPQSHFIVRFVRSFISLCIVPQQWHICDDGYHLSALIRYLFLSVSLYASIDRNIPYPLSRAALPPYFSHKMLYIRSGKEMCYNIAIVPLSIKKCHAWSTDHARHFNTDLYYCFFFFINSTAPIPTTATTITPIQIHGDA